MSTNNGKDLKKGKYTDQHMKEHRDALEMPNQPRIGANAAAAASAEVSAKRFRKLSADQQMAATGYRKTPSGDIEDLGDE